MRRFSLAVLASLSLCSLGSAQDRPDTPPPKLEARVLDKKFYFVIGALAAAKTADAITTERVLSRGCHESNPLFGPYPSSGRIAGLDVAAFAIESGTAYLLKRYSRKHRWARYAWPIAPARQTALHIYWAAHNEGLRCP